MERNYPEIIAALRRKAADKSVAPEESELFTEKANELAKKYGVTESNRQAYNGQVPTWEEFREHFNQQAHHTPYTRPPPDVPFTTVYVVTIHFSEWLGSLDEDNSQNEWEEFPQEQVLGKV